jgi:hypothetical protein
VKGTAWRITDNRVMALNEWSKRKKINKTLHIKLSSYSITLYYSGLKEGDQVGYDSYVDLNIYGFLLLAFMILS